MGMEKPEQAPHQVPEAQHPGPGAADHQMQQRGNHRPQQNRHQGKGRKGHGDGSAHPAGDAFHL